jgi:hypothetical protein
MQALLEFCKANGGLGAKGKSVVPIDVQKLASFLGGLLEFLQTCDEDGLEAALQGLAIEIAEETSSAIVSAVLETLLDDWPPVLRDLVRAAILAAISEAAADDADPANERLGLRGLADQGVGNLVAELLAQILVKAYMHQLQAALDRTDANNRDQRIHREQLLDAARNVVAEVLEAWQENLDDADWTHESAQTLLSEALKELKNRLGKGPP